MPTAAAIPATPMPNAAVWAGTPPVDPVELPPAPPARDEPPAPPLPLPPVDIEPEPDVEPMPPDIEVLDAPEPPAPPAVPAVPIPATPPAVPLVPYGMELPAEGRGGTTPAAVALATADEIAAADGVAETR